MDPVFHIAVMLFLAWIMVTAGLHKIRRPLYFGFVIDDYRLLPVSAGRVIAIPLGVAEVTSGIALCVPATQSWGAALAALLFSVYFLAIAINLLRNRRDIDCGCHGPFQQQPLSGWLLLRNGVLIVLILLVSTGASSRALGWLDWWVVLGVLVSIALLYVIFETLLGNINRLPTAERNL